MRHIRTDGGRAIGVELENGQQLECRNVLSSAGIAETMRLSGVEPSSSATRSAGQMSFIEAISVLDRQPQQLGHDQTIVFFNDSDTFHWQRPDDELCDTRTGVICSPNNFMYGSDVMEEGVIRVTMIADFRRWSNLSEEAYRLAKLAWYDRSAESTVRFVPDYRGYVIDTDMFTPRTIRRFTWHDNGAVYGAPDKRLDGRTSIENLYICGSDQGYVGIIGTILSGTLIANRYLLREP